MRRVALAAPPESLLFNRTGRRSLILLILTRHYEKGADKETAKYSAILLYRSLDCPLIQMSELSTPVALFVYRRPEHTERVIERIRNANPPRVLVVGDGPSGKAERENVEEVRRVINQTRFECEVSTNYADSNLGLRERFTTGLDWIFGETDEAIILEDDTLPNSSFFRFCDEMIDRYRHDNRIWDITGRNELGSYCEGDYSYFYSHYGSIWGWATWRSSYEEYDPEMSAWRNPVVQNRIRDLLADPKQYRYARRVYSDTLKGDIQSWDYQWGFARHRNGAVSVVPEVNLVKNIGFGKHATNTTKQSPYADTRRHVLQFPLNHPPFVGVDREYDERLHELRQQGRLPFSEQIKSIMDRLL